MVGNIRKEQAAGADKPSAEPSGKEGKSMARRGENIYLRKDGRYEGRYIKGRKANGKAEFASVYGRKYGEVKRRLVEKKSQLYGEKGSVWNYGDGSVEAWGEYYLESEVKARVKVGTYENYRRDMKRHIAPLLGKEKLRELRRVQIQEAERELEGRLSGGTVRGVMRLLKAILAAAVEKGVLEQSPYREIRLPCGGKKRPRVLSVREQKKLEGEVKRSGGMEYLICLYTGLRVGEVCGLRWEDIDLEGHVLQVRHTVKRTKAEGGRRKTALRLEGPKTESGCREIPLPAFLVGLLKNARREGANGFVFKGVGGGMRDTRTMQKKLERICEKVGLEGVHMHTLRHSFSTRCLEQGVGVEVLSALLGHSTPQITLKYYAHCTPEAKREGIALLARMA